MSSIAAVFSGHRAPENTARCVMLRRAMPPRGLDVTREWSGPSGALVSGSHAWEQHDAFGWGATLARRGPLVVVADAVLYHVSALRSKLESHGATLTSLEPAALIAAAYETWGGLLIHHLDGDFAFVVRDEAHDTVTMGRDHVGSRPLHYHQSAATLSVASLARALAAQPWISAPLNDLMLAAAMGGLPGGSERTAFDGVVPVPAGATLTWTPGGEVVQVARWLPPEFRVGGRPDFREGALELRRLLTEATAERGDSAVAIWLSGGADSTAVYGALQNARQTGASGVERIHAVTTSFAEGDLAREDHFVQDIIDRWRGNITWVNSDTTSILGAAREHAAGRDDPYGHTYHAMNLRMAAAAREQDIRIVFDGYGGDQLFQAADPYLADMALRLDWAEVRRARRGRGAKGWKSLVKQCVIPWMPGAVVDAIQRVRQAGDDSLAVPEWVTARWSGEKMLRAWAHFDPPRRILESPSSYEARLYAQSPYFPRAIGWNGTTGLGSGISIRSPLQDRRVVEFAATRPVSERAYNGETKRLLRAAMEGLLPDSVIAPRPVKTGIPGPWLQWRIREELPEAAAEALLGPHRPLLAERGLLDVSTYSRQLRNYLLRGDHTSGVQLLLTLQVEYWLRSLEAPTLRSN